MKLLNWLRSSVEGKDGRSSARALTNAWYVGLNTTITICVIVLAFIIIDKTDITVNKYSVDTLWALIYLSAIYNMTILLIFGIVSMQQITELSKSIRGGGTIPDPITVETFTTTEVKSHPEE